MAGQPWLAMASAGWLAGWLGWLSYGETIGLPASASVPPHPTLPALAGRVALHMRKCAYVTGGANPTRCPLAQACLRKPARAHGEAGGTSGGRPGSHRPTQPHPRKIPALIFGLTESVVAADRKRGDWGFHPVTQKRGSGLKCRTLLGLAQHVSFAGHDGEFDWTRWFAIWGFPVHRSDRDPS